MKKIVFILVFTCAFVFTAQSQLRFGVRGGVNFTNFSSDRLDNIIDNDVTGFHIGPTVEWLIDGSFGVEASALYAEKGIKLKDRSTNRFGYLDIPVSAKYRFDISNVINPFVDAGPYISFRVSKDDSFTANQGSIDEQWKAKNFAAGMNFGAGVEIIKRFQVKANYGFSLTDNFKLSQADGGYEAKDKTWSITASVYF